MERGIPRRRDGRRRAIALLTLAALAGASSVVSATAAAAPSAPADSAAVARTPGIGRLTLLACAAGARVAARAGWVGVSAGATVCVAGIWYDVRSRWPRPASD